jgi:hypothetical protein
MKPVLIIFLCFALFSFLAGIYYCANADRPIESMNTDEPKVDPTAKSSDENCPDLLIKSGNAILLYNTKKEEKEGENPIPFYSIDEYINYVEIQKRKGISCPVLFLQEETNTQGDTVYRARPGPFNQNGGLHSSQPLNRNTPKTGTTGPRKVIDATRENPPYNANNYAGFDPYGQDIGIYTDLDKIHNSTGITDKVSDNPMDSNWGGVVYTHDVVESGKYKDNEVVPPSQNSMFSLPSDSVKHQSKKNIFA